MTGVSRYFFASEASASPISSRSCSTSARPSRICSTAAVSVMSCVVAPQWQYSPSLSRQLALIWLTTAMIG